MTVQRWCKENGINPKTYYYHMRKLREKCVASVPAIVPLSVPITDMKSTAGQRSRLFCFGDEPL